MQDPILTKPLPRGIQRVKMLRAGGYSFQFSFKAALKQSAPDQHIFYYESGIEGLVVADMDVIQCMQAEQSDELQYQTVHQSQPLQEYCPNCNFDWLSASYVLK